MNRLELKTEELLYQLKTFLSNKQAQEHLQDGLTQRHYIIRRCHDYLTANCAKQKENSLSVYETTEAALFINAFYLNLRGALDNLAWILQFELNIIKTVSTTSSSDRMKISLFGKDFLKSLADLNADLINIINNVKTWGVDLAKFRDPAAHRIPLYVPHSIIDTQEQLKEHKRLNDIMEKNAHNLTSAQHFQIIQDIRDIASFKPLFIITSEEGLKIYNISEQIPSDYRKYLELTTAILSDLYDNKAV
ncbi:MAG: hypothetical protein PF692_15105 [Kiritimatiellae bacterium]|nr:hypothetical protein [Kiritimatiellia bacterium]